MSKKLLGSIILSVLSLSVGCVDEQDAADADEGLAAEEAEEIGSTSQAIAMISGATFTWRQGQPDINMGSSSNRFCFLTGVSGRFKGGGEWVRVINENSAWILRGGSEQRDVQATARCVPLSWQGRTFGYSSTFSWTQGQAAVNMGSTTNRTCFLTGVMGKFEGSGEHVEAVKGTSSWFLQGGSEQRDVTAWSRCLTGSTPVGWQSGLGMTAGSEHRWAQGQTPTDTRRVASVYTCGLTRMRGKFDGSGEWISVYPALRGFDSEPEWYITGGSEQRDVLAGAYCAH